MESNWNNIREVSAKYVPLLNKAEYVKSIFVDRIVDANRMDTDARLTELTSHGNGCWSMFAAKIITCESMAKKITSEIRGHTT